MKERKMEVIVAAVLLAFVGLVIVFGAFFIGQIEIEPSVSSNNSIFIESVKDKKEDSNVRFENLKSKLGTVLNLDKYWTNSMTMGGTGYYEFNLNEENRVNGEKLDFTLEIKDGIVIGATKTQEEVAELLDKYANYDDTVSYYNGNINIIFSFEKDHDGHIWNNSALCKYEIQIDSASDNDRFSIGKKITNNSSIEDIVEAFGLPTKIVLSGYDTDNAAVIKIRYEKTYTNYVEFTVDCNNGRITDIISEIEKLSNGCDVILATGRDENGSLFELVGYEEEDYIGATTKIGVIKDDVWLVEPTTEFPFIDSGKLLTNGKSIFSLNSENNPDYIGNGCFEFDNIIYNCNNGKNFNIRKALGPNAYSKKDFGNTDNNQRNNILLLLYNLRIYALNTSTMEYSMIIENSYTARAYNDGLFAAKLEYKDSFAFYNLKGERIIDLSMYNFKEKNNGRDVSSDLIFNDGKCTFDIINDKGSTYSITIDKIGNVLESTKIE